MKGLIKDICHAHMLQSSVRFIGVSEEGKEKLSEEFRKEILSVLKKYTDNGEHKILNSI